MPGIDPRIVDRMLRNEADMSFRKRARTVLEWIPTGRGMHILDLACGRGYYLNMLRHVASCQLAGVDLDRRVLQQAQRMLGHLPDLLLARADAARLPWARDSFDAIILSEVLEHVADDHAVLRECRRVLRPGGVVAITVPHANYPFAWDPVNKTLETLLGAPIRRGPLAGIWANHRRLYTPDQLRERVLETGFIIEAERAMTHHAFPFSHNLVYGLGMPLLESGLLPQSLSTVVDRSQLHSGDGARLNPFRLALRVLEWFDRDNLPAEPPGRATVNLALRARKPA